MTNSDTSKKFDSVQLYRIRKLLSELSSKTGRGTELVTLYLPPKKAIHEAISALREESGTASNIKSDTTRAHVQDALTKTIQRLRLYKQTPENGLIIFCGAIPGPGGPGKETVELYEVLPSKPVTTYLYRCVAPDTRILLSNGEEKTIDELKSCWRKESVASYDIRKRILGEAQILRYIETSSDGRKTYRLMSETGRSIVATEDHPFATPRGWVRMGELKIGDALGVIGDRAPNRTKHSNESNSCGTKTLQVLEKVDLLSWERVTNLEQVELEDVRDLTIESNDHTFFANGFLVHNCDDHFHLDPLREMLKEENVIGVLALDATEAGLGIVSGDNWEVVDVTSSGVSGKTRKGGQSARRYERLREMELTEYYTRLADHAKKAFLEQYNVKGLIVSGPGPTKDQFVKDNYLDYRLQKAIVGVLDTGYVGREGVRETIEKSGDLLQNVRVVEESKLVQRFLREINSDSGLAMYGANDVIRALKRAAVEVILISDDADMLFLRATCAKCQDVREKFIRRSQYVSEKQSLLSSPCPKCGNQEIQVIEKDIVDYFADLSLDSSASVEVISSKTEDGAMLKSFGGISALLRYKV